MYHQTLSLYRIGVPKTCISRLTNYTDSQLNNLSRKLTKPPAKVKTIAGERAETYQQCIGYFDVYEDF